MKIYTKTGDKGTTALLGGERTSKADIRVELYGTIDELNSHLGLSHELIQKSLDEKARQDLLTAIASIQSELFSIGAELASLSNQHTSKLNIKKLEEASIIQLEGWIDTWTTELEPLQAFILPGGHQAAGQLHIARSVCRRSERLLVQVMSEYKTNETILRYVNRLSDLLFTAARVVNKRTGREDQLWKH